VISLNWYTWVVWKVSDLNMKMTLLIKTILVLQSYMLWKILVKIVTILDVQLLFDSHFC